MTSPPTFLVIGAARSGTTALVRFLEQHPQIFVCEPKEPHFFAFAEQHVDFRGPGDDVSMNRVVVTNPDRYAALFAGAAGSPARGDGSASTLYYHEHAIPTIGRFAPDVKLVVMLRNPVARAYSSFLYLTSRGFEPETDFVAALDDEPRRIAERWHHLWHYLAMGRYAAQLQAFVSAFGRDRLKIIVLDDFRAEPGRVMAELFAFLGVDASFEVETSAKINRSGKPKGALIGRGMNLLQRHAGLKAAVKAIVPASLRERLRAAALDRPEMPQAALDRLRREYVDEIGTLGELLGRDLSHWLVETESAD